MLRSPHSAMKINEGFDQRCDTRGSFLRARGFTHLGRFGEFAVLLERRAAGIHGQRVLERLDAKNTNIATAAYSPMGSVARERTVNFERSPDGDRDDRIVA